MKTPLSPILALALALAAGCSRHGDATVASTPSLPPVRARVEILKLQEMPVLTELSGTVRPVERAALAAKVMGLIAELHVSLGQKFHKGDLLLRITAAEIGARVAQARSQLNLAQRDLERERELLQKQASTAEMVRSLEDRHSLALEQVREAEAMLAYTELRAPFDGVITRKYVNAGDLASPGLPLLELEGFDQFEVEVRIPESIAANLKPGMGATVDLPSLGQRFETTLRELSPASDTQARAALAKLRVPAGLALGSGHYARVILPTGSQSLLLVPRTALSPLGQMERVFVVHDGRAQLRLVRTGAERGTQVEVLSGLSAGEHILVAPAASLVENQMVEVLP